MRHLLKTIILAAALPLLFASCANEEKKADDKELKTVDINTVQPTDTVFICTGKSSTHYHAYPNCAGLTKCSKAVNGVTRAEAEAKRRSHCHTCYRDSKK